MGSTAPSKNFTVTIVGGGIGGLSLAVGLLRRNVPVQIYEAAPAFAEIGLGLSIGPAAHRAMPLIDPQIRAIYDSLVTTHADSPGYEAFRQTWFEIVWASGQHEGETLMDLKALPSGQTTLRRADFLEALVNLIPPHIVHFGKRLEKLAETADGVDLRFDDGTEVRADMVVGCDGIKSKVKEYIVPGEAQKPRFSGMYAYRAVLDMEDMVKAVGDQRARVSTMYVGKGAYGISYPIMRAKKVNVGFYILSDTWDHESWVRPAKKEDMRRDASHMGRYVQSLVEVSFFYIYLPRMTRADMLSSCPIPHNGRSSNTRTSRRTANPESRFLETLLMRRHRIRARVLVKPLKMHTFSRNFSVILASLV